MQTPRFCGELCSAGLAVLYFTCWRPLRTNWLIVGIFLVIGCYRSRFCILALKAQKGPWPASFRNLSGSQRRQTALLLNLLKGRSDFAVQAGADLASQLARNIAEAFLWRRAREWVRCLRTCLISKSLRHNNQRFDAIASHRATPPHRQNQLQRCTRGPQTVVRNGRL